MIDELLEYARKRAHGRGEEAIDLFVANKTENTDVSVLEVDSLEDVDMDQFWYNLNRLLASMMTVHDMRQVIKQNAEIDTFKQDVPPVKELQQVKEKVDKSSDTDILAVVLTSTLKGICTFLDVGWTIVKTIIQIPVVGQAVTLYALHRSGMTRVLARYLRSQLPEWAQAALNAAERYYSAGASSNLSAAAEGVRNVLSTTRTNIWNRASNVMNRANDTANSMRRVFDTEESINFEYYQNDMYVDNLNLPDVELPEEIRAADAVPEEYQAETWEQTYDIYPDDYYKNFDSVYDVAIPEEQIEEEQAFEAADEPVLVNDGYYSNVAELDRDMEILREQARQQMGFYEGVEETDIGFEPVQRDLFTIEEEEVMVGEQEAAVLSADMLGVAAGVAGVVFMAGMLIYRLVREKKKKREAREAIDDMDAKYKKDVENALNTLGERYRFPSETYTYNTHLFMSNKHVTSLRDMLGEGFLKYAQWRSLRLKHGKKVERPSVQEAIDFYYQLYKKLKPGDLWISNTTQKEPHRLNDEVCDKHNEMVGIHSDEFIYNGNVSWEKYVQNWNKLYVWSLKENGEAYMQASTDFVKKHIYMDKPFVILPVTTEAPLSVIKTPNFIEIFEMWDKSIKQGKDDLSEADMARVTLVTNCTQHLEDAISFVNRTETHVQRGGTFPGTTKATLHDVNTDYDFEENEQLGLWDLYMWVDGGVKYMVAKAGSAFFMVYKKPQMKDITVGFTSTLAVAAGLRIVSKKVMMPLFTGSVLNMAMFSKAPAYVVMQQSDVFNGGAMMTVEQSQMIFTAVGTAAAAVGTAAASAASTAASAASTAASTAASAAATVPVTTIFYTMKTLGSGTFVAFKVVFTAAGTWLTPAGIGTAVGAGLVGTAFYYHPEKRAKLIENTADLTVNAVGAASEVAGAVTETARGAKVITGAVVDAVDYAKDVFGGAAVGYVVIAGIGVAFSIYTKMPRGKTSTRMKPYNKKIKK
jgi:hypothetical protein